MKVQMEVYEGLCCSLVVNPSANPDIATYGSFNLSVTTGRSRCGCRDCMHSAAGNQSSQAFRQLGSALCQFFSCR